MLSDYDLAGVVGGVNNAENKPNITNLLISKFSPEDSPKKDFKK